MSDKVENKNFERIKEIVSFFGMINAVDWSGQEVDYESGLVLVYKVTPEELLALDEYLFAEYTNSGDKEEVFEPKSSIKVILEGFEFILIPNDKDIYVK